jgi:hypothetical protein
MAIRYDGLIGTVRIHGVNAAGVQFKDKQTSGDSALMLFLTASDMWHPCGGLTRNWSALDRDCAGNTCHNIE